MKVLMLALWRQSDGTIPHETHDMQGRFECNDVYCILQDGCEGGGYRVYESLKSSPTILTLPWITGWKGVPLLSLRCSPSNPTKTPPCVRCIDCNQSCRHSSFLVSERLLGPSSSLTVLDLCVLFFLHTNSLRWRDRETYVQVVTNGPDPSNYVETVLLL